MNDRTGESPRMPFQWPTMYTAVAIALLLFLMVETARLFLPFVGPILCAISIGVLFYPMHRSFARHFSRGMPSMVALLSDAAVALVLILPLFLIGWGLTSEANGWGPTIQAESHSLAQRMEQKPPQTLPILNHLPAPLARWVSRAQLRWPQHIGEVAGEALRHVGLLSAVAARHTLRFILDVLIFLFVLFFVFRDGAQMTRQAASLFPMRSSSKERLERELHATIVGTIGGNFVTWAFEAISATLGFWIVHNPAPLLLGLLTFIASVVPSIGAPLIWGPLAIYYLVIGALWKGVFLIIWGIAVVGVLDHLLRPYLIGRGSSVSFLWIFFGLLGGIEVFGLMGIIIGPMLICTVTVLLGIYRQQLTEEPILK